MHFCLKPLTVSMIIIWAPAALWLLEEHSYDTARWKQKRKLPHLQHIIWDPPFASSCLCTTDTQRLPNHSLLHICHVAIFFHLLQRTVNTGNESFISPPPPFKHYKVKDKSAVGLWFLWQEASGSLMTEFQRNQGAFNMQSTTSVRNCRDDDGKNLKLLHSPD